MKKNFFFVLRSKNYEICFELNYKSKFVAYFIMKF